MRSLISVAMSRDNNATTYSNIGFWLVIPCGQIELHLGEPDTRVMMELDGNCCNSIVFCYGFCQIWTSDHQL